MQFNFDQEYTKGDLEGRARGTESLMRNEIEVKALSGSHKWHKTQQWLHL